METWKTLMRRRGDFTTKTATPMYATFLCEALDRGQLPLPAGAPSFAEAGTSYARAKWLGPARGYIDGVKEPQGAQLRMDTAVSTLRDEAAEQGNDWEEQIEQRAVEVQFFKDKKLDPPSWAMIQNKADEEQGSHDPDSPNYKSGGR